MYEDKINSIIRLNEKFIKIKNLGFVDGINEKSKGNAGITFENLIGKENDNFQIADFDGIEIKVQNSFNSRLIRLFSLVPSNCFGIELKRLRNCYGKNDYFFKNVKTLQGFISTTTISKISNEYKFQLKIDYLNEKLYLLVFDKSNNLIEKKVYWDFDDLSKIFERKLNILAIVNFKKKKTNNNTQFHYTEINYYKIKSIVVFFKLIELGKIKINFDLGIYRSGKRIGKEHDNGIFFYLNNSDFHDLYYKIEL